MNVLFPIKVALLIVCSVVFGSVVFLALAKAYGELGASMLMLGIALTAVLATEVFK